MPVKAYIMVTVEPGATQQVVAALRKVRHATEVNEVLGPYDVVVELEPERLDDITEVLRRAVRPNPGIRNTLTCVVMR